jgi:hypothetical protein
MTSASEVALRHAAARRRLVLDLAAEAKAAWSGVDANRISATWQRQVARLLVILAGAQRVAADQADDYLDDVLDVQGIDNAAEARVATAALTGVASDGRPLESLLYQPAITALTGIQRGAGVARSMAGGSAVLDMIVRTQVADAGRVADQVAMVTRPRTSGYVRMLVGRSCSRCAVLAGRWYASNAGFRRHPRCLPAGVVVSGPAVDAATRRFYEGELVVLATASGQELPITGNHPVLTDRGWIPANLVEEGDYVVRSTRREGASALVVPDEDQVPARIEDLWRPDGVMPLFQVPTATEDFHGDGGHGDVDVVLSDRLLSHRLQPSFAQQELHDFVSGGVVRSSLLPLLGASDQEFLGVAATSIGSFVRRLGDELASALVGLHATGGSDWRRTPHLLGASGLTASLIGGHLGSAHLSGFGHSADCDPGLFEAFADRPSGNLETLTQAVFALPGQVRGGYLGNGQNSMGPRWDPPGDPFTVESRVTYACRGKDLLTRLAGQVELDRVVERRSVQWSGHVYNLSSVEGWYSANGLIVSNCDCIHIPGRENITGDERTDPKAFFNSLSPAEQDKVFTKAGAESIRLGADISQVVNARRGAAGLTTAGARLTADEAQLLRGGRQVGRLETRNVFGQQLFTTTEGTTARGTAGVRLGAKVDGVKTGNARYRSARAPRLMPESILQIAGTDRGEALRLLKRYGYLT